MPLKGTWQRRIAYAACVAGLVGLAAAGSMGMRAASDWVVGRSLSPALGAVEHAWVEPGAHHSLAPTSLPGDAGTLWLGAGIRGPGLAGDMKLGARITVGGDGAKARVLEIVDLRRHELPAALSPTGTALQLLTVTARVVGDSTGPTLRFIVEDGPAATGKPHEHTTL